MQVSLNWIKEFVDIKDLSVEEIVNGLTMSGLEVEEVKKIGPKFTNIRLAKIVKLEKHPNADKLRLATINLGKNEFKTVVCGAKNINEGDLVPFATIGSKVFSRKDGNIFELTPIKIRGIESEGMLCSQDELDLVDYNYQKEDGVLILNDLVTESQIGEKIQNVLELEEDIILITSPTANRGDEMSIVGVARELSAIFGRKLNLPKIDTIEGCYVKPNFEVRIKDMDCCSRYCIGIIKDLEVKSSPNWMQKRLISCGIRPINNIVDVTNYVLLEYGLPLHAFDLDKLDGYLCVRKAKIGEKIVTLDEKERNLDQTCTVISDSNKPVCVAGVFGGRNSEVDENTTNIALEAANFCSLAIRKSARAIGYRSEASARFERGIDPDNIEFVLMRACKLILELCSKTAKFEGVVQAISEEVKNREIEIVLRFSQVKKILDCDIEPKTCIDILQKLGFRVISSCESSVKFKVPGFRLNDVTREIDLIEEIARIYGYDKIESKLPSSNFCKVSLNKNILNKINNIFLSSGFSEAITSSLIGEVLLDDFDVDYDYDRCVRVKNAQSDEFCLLRQSLIASMLKVLKYNFDNGQKNTWLYEIGKTYFKISEPCDREQSGVSENQVLCFATLGNIIKGRWKNNLQQVDFFYIKGILENLFNILNISNRIIYEQSVRERFLHPYRSAKILILDKNPIEIGFFGQIHPALKDKHKITNEIFIGQIDLDKILKIVQNKTKKFESISVYPSVQRDLAFIINKDITFEQIMKVFKKANKEKLLANVELFDIYSGENIEPGYQSLAFHLTFCDKNSTLNNEIINRCMENIRKVLNENLENINFREEN